MDGGATSGGGGGGGGGHAGETQQQAPTIQTNTRPATPELDESQFPQSPRGASTPNPFSSRRNTGLDLDDYFTGPRDISKHSKWPLFMQMHGSILPKLIVPLFIVGGWTSMITCVDRLVEGANLGISNNLLTVTGFVVGLGLSFRSATAYERYAEGRRHWGDLVLACQNLGRCFWIHTLERPGMEKQDLLGKLTAMNLLVAFAVSLKHKLRFEPYTHYQDLTELVEHLDTFAEAATKERFKPASKKSVFKVVGESLGMSFAQSNPRKLMKKAESPLGNLPLEILCYLSSYVDDLCTNNAQLTVGMQQTAAYSGLQALNDMMVNTERVLNTPLPIAYAIAIQQITWLYIFIMPFQLVNDLEWITIPAVLAASAIILSILFIGREIENPFGNDVNDLPLDLFCAQIVADLEVISARPKPKRQDWIEHPDNKVLYLGSDSGYQVWAQRPRAAIERVLRKRPWNAFEKENSEHPQQAPKPINSASTTAYEKGDNNV